MTSPGCVFCEIAAGKRDAIIIASTDREFAIVPLNPVVEGHLIVMPREHVIDAADDPEVAGRVMVLAASLAQENVSSNIITSRGAARIR